MSISRQNLSVIIVSFKSDHIIHRCITSIDKKEIIIVDNSNNVEFKNNIEKQYSNVKCILSSKNIGMGAEINNLGIKNTNKDFTLILNPDVILNKNTINEIIKASKENRFFSNYANF